MAKRRLIIVPGIVLAVLLLIGALLALPGRSISQPKGLPTSALKDQGAPGRLSAAQVEQARQIAMADGRVQQALAGEHYQFVHALPVWHDFGPASNACAIHTCAQAELFDFTRILTLVVMVDLDAGQVTEVIPMPHSFPEVNAELADLVIRLASTDPKVLAEVKGRRFQASMAPDNAWMPEGPCAVHWCVGPSFAVEGVDAPLIVIVDLNDLAVVHVTWSQSSAPSGPMPMEEAPETCPDPGTVSQDGWSVNYEPTNTDGLRLYDVTYNGQLVFQSLKLPQVNVWYASGGYGYMDSLGCNGIVPPYGQTQVIQISGGFQILQDFRMSGWPHNCNYRYEQQVTFYTDGRFTPEVSVYGPGCAYDGLYRPFLRVDIGPAGQLSNFFQYFTDGVWTSPAVEGDFPKNEQPQVQGYQWRQLGADQGGYQVSPTGKDDEHYIELVHYADEGDNDLPTQGVDPQQIFPLQWANGESIQDQDLLLWLVPESQTTQNPPYCWSAGGTPNPCTNGLDLQVTGPVATLPPPSATPTATVTPSPTVTTTATATPSPSPTVGLMNQYLPLVSK